MNQTSSPSSSLRTSNFELRTSPLAWHGWTLALPDEWGPVKIEGDWSKGSIVIADLHATRLAIRWQTAPKSGRFDADAWTRKTIQSELGQESLEQSTVFEPEGEWSAGRLFLETDPPGRDVWCGHSTTSHRLIEVVHQATKRTFVLRNEIVPSLGDQKPTGAMRWSIFDLSCVAPAGWTLKSQRLNAGDLTLTFGRRNDVLIVRQLGPAKLALARQPLSQWLNAHVRVWRKTYRSAGENVAFDDNRGDALERPLRRRRRFSLAPWVAKARTAVALLDAERDRLVIIDASSREHAMQMLETVGKLNKREPIDHERP